MATTQTIPEFFLLTSNVFWETSPVFQATFVVFQVPVHMLWETHKVKLENISPIFGFLFCLDNVQNKHKKIKDKYLNPRYLPSIILIFSTFVLFFDSGLRGPQVELKINRLHTFSELVLYDIRINHTLYSKNVQRKQITDFVTLRLRLAPPLMSIEYQYVTRIL